MKALFFSLFVMTLMAGNSVRGQSKKTRYAEFVFKYNAHNQINGPDGKGYINAGNEKNNVLFKDSTVLIRLKKSETFGTLSGALDYLNDIGWNAHTAFSFLEHGVTTTRIILYKDFQDSEIVEFSK